jgi:hypothetical protein
MNRFRRIHLGTAIVMMIVAGILLGLNFRPPRVVYGTVRHWNITKTGQGGKEEVIEYTACGWPFAESRFLSRPLKNIETPWTEEIAQVVLDDAIARGQFKHYEAGRYCFWRVVYKNVAFGLIITLLCGVLSEYLFRRKYRVETSA